MKVINKIFAVLICLVLVCSCAVFAVYAEDAVPTGKITIQNPGNSEATVAGKTFEIYRIFNATSKGANVSYSWFTTGEAGNETNPYYDFFFTGDDAYVENKTNGTAQEAVEEVSKTTTHSLDMSQFANKLYTYIDTKNIAPVKTVTAGDSVTSVEITDLPYGYYLIYDATTLEGKAVRSAVMLDTVNDNIIITLKANRPELLKQVLENDGTYGKGTSSSIGDTVSFMIETEIPDHSLYSVYDYKIEDKMHDGLALDTDSIKIYKATGNVETEVSNDAYTLTLNPTNEIDFTVDFTGKLSGDNKKWEVGDKVIIKYDAIVTKDISNINVNTAVLTYHNDPIKLTHGNTSSDATVYSYQFVFTKFAENASGSLLNLRLGGAQFELYRVDNNNTPDDTSDDTKTKVYFTTTTETVTHNGQNVNFTKYIVADTTISGQQTVDYVETHNEGEATITLDHLNMGGHLGDIAIFGLAEGSYELLEIKAPDGYVCPDKPFAIEIIDTIGDLGSVSQLEVTGSHTGAGSILNTKGMAESILTVWAEITNKPGSALPETGGIGTTVFTVFGIIMMAGAVAFFTSRKRSRAN